MSLTSLPLGVAGVLESGGSRSMHHCLRFEEPLEIPTDREPQRISYLGWQSTGSTYHLSGETCPPSSKDYHSGSCRHLSQDQHSVPARSLPGGYRRLIILLCFPVPGPSLQIFNKSN
ncbi:hypothetical protein CRENBAI_024984 [Crenichthys baileyi]|uniref:Uncharacterized protein n=1 Tax=Crenichthys baileyi TaxID=28760 RepID=A0AAV9S3H6_9TELE